MKQRNLLLMMASVLLLWASGSVSADEISDLKEQLRIQGEMLKQLQQKIADIEARQQAKEQAMTKKIDAVAQKTEAVAQQTEAVALRTKKIETLRPSTSSDWTKRIKWSGDFRYRHESIDQETDSNVRWKDGRNRHRFRARLMLEAILNDEWDLGFRLASGDPDSPTSTNQTMDNGFSSKDIWLDLAYFDYHPAAVNGLNVYGGKIKNPFYKVGKNQLIFDGDVNPEGLAFVLERPINDRDTIRFTGGGFWVDEGSGDGGDPSLFGAQVLIKHQVGNPDTVIVGASYYDYGNIKGRGNLWDGATSFLGNSNAGGVYTQDYDLLEVFGEYQTKCGDRPVSFYGNWVHNTAATTGEDTGWLVGGTYNKAKDPGSWQFSYAYRDLEADAVVGLFSDSDFIGGGTDGKGHVFGFAYQVKKNVQAALTYFLNEDRANTAGRDFDYHRLQADLKFKFK
jgi:hypothetical protein